MASIQVACQGSPSVAGTCTCTADCSQLTYNSALRVVIALNWSGNGGLPEFSAGAYWRTPEANGGGGVNVNKMDEKTADSLFEFVGK